MHKFIIKISFIHSSSYNLTNHMLGISAVVEDSKLAKGAGSDSILANGAPTKSFTSSSSTTLLGSSTQVARTSESLDSLSCNSMVLSDSRTVSFCSSVMSAVFSAVSSSIMVSSLSGSLYKK